LRIKEIPVGFRYKFEWKPWFSSTSARCKVCPRAQIHIIPSASFADNPFTYVNVVAFEML
jgi:hypothetical protein